MPKIWLDLAYFLAFCPVNSGKQRQIHFNFINSENVARVLNPRPTKWREMWASRIATPTGMLMANFNRITVVNLVHDIC